MHETIYDTIGLQTFLSKQKEVMSSERPFSHQREKAWEKATQVLLSKKNEAYTYLNRLKKLEELSFTPADKFSISGDFLPESSRIVFINGYFCKELSFLEENLQGAFLLEEDKAVLSYGPILKMRMDEQIKKEKDFFALMNLALHQKSAFLYLPPKLMINNPLQFVSIVTQENVVAFPRLQVMIGKDAHLLFEVQEIVQKNSLHIPSIYFHQDQSSSVKMQAITQQDNSHWSFASYRSDLKRDAKFDFLSVNKGGESKREDIYLRLLEENSEATAKGVWFVDNDKQMHTHVRMEHLAENARSFQLFKGMVKDEAISSFTGGIYVDPIAQETQSYQLNNNLVLSDHAKAFTKPNLNIYADNVKASHGATIAQIDKELIFYLCSRGIDLPMARRLILQSFCSDVIEAIFSKDKKEQIYQELTSYIKEV